MGAKKNLDPSTALGAGSDAQISTLASQIYRSLSEKIVLGDLPPGHRLEEKALATQYGVSRTPVREALRQLGARNLIDLMPRRGGVVSEFSVEGLTDMLDAECELEGLCARLASQRMAAVEKGELMELHERAARVIENGQLESYYELNAAFHNQICHGTNNPTLAAIVKDLRMRLSPFRRPQIMSSHETMARSHVEHSNIVNAIVEGNGERAYEAMRAHNGRVNVSVLQVLRR